MADSISEDLHRPVYTRVFWLAYVANVVLVGANALTFRFAELVSFLGGAEDLAGDIAGCALLAAVVVRLSVSHLIDDWGTRRFWSLMTLCFLVGCFLCLMARQLGPMLYVARAFYMTGLTGMYACSMTHIQNHVPPHRRTEAIGNLGSSGFVGMIGGSYLGDWIVTGIPQPESQFATLFGTATALGLIYLVIVLVLTAGHLPQPRQRTTPAWQLIVRHWPGGVTVVALVMGLGIAVTTVFLTRFATQQGIRGLATFFSGYAISAFVFRITARNWSYLMGRYWMLVIGMLGHAVGHALLPFVSVWWHFVVPSIICGFGHALLFPGVVSLGSGAYPLDSRGSGTASILAIVDVGSLIFAALLGRIIVQAGFPAMFWTSSALAALAAFWYAIIAWKWRDPETGRGGALWLRSLS